MLILPSIIQQHADEAASLYEFRRDLLRTPQATLSRLREWDNRLEAHLDGLAVAGEGAWQFCEAALELVSSGSVFSAAIRAIGGRKSEGLERLFALAATVPEARAGLIAAFGWMNREHLSGIVATALGSDNPLKRVVGMAACGVQRVEPGSVLNGYLEDETPEVRARTLRTIGEVGIHRLIQACDAAASDEANECRFWACWSAVLLGNRQQALDELLELGLAGGVYGKRALQLALLATGRDEAHSALTRMAKDSAQLRWLIYGSGIVGDPSYVVWLINQMSNPLAARAAGEAFSVITGTDHALLDLERKPPENFESGPNDDPGDPNVDMDPDDGLPWPDPDRIKDWWAKNGGRFQPGTRYFMGAPVTREHCIDVLKNGYQRQRILAAHYLCLLDPGTPLFNTSAPAWRQQRLLAEMR